MLKILTDGFEQDSKQEQEKLDQRINMKKRIQKENEKLIKKIKKQFREHVAAIKEKDEHDGLVVQDQV